MKILIFGGSGFLGNSIVCKDGFDNYQFHIADIIEPKSSNLFSLVNIAKKDDFANISGNFDAIINLAAAHRDDIEPKSLYYDVNVQGSINICDFARKQSIDKIIFVSSAAVYGNSSKEVFEDSEHNYFNKYGETKSQAEKIYEKWLDEDKFNRNLTIIRPTVIFGPGNRGNVYNLISSIAKNKFLMIGDGKNRKSMCYVENVADFIIFSLNFKGKNIYNYVDKPDLSMLKLVNLIHEELGIKRKNFFIPKNIGFLFGAIFDIFKKIFKIDLPISYIRIKKFTANSIFGTNIKNTSFRPAFKLKDSLIKTIRSEFKK